MADPHQEREGLRGEGSSYAPVILLALMLLFGLVALPFMPLLLSLCENVAFGTDRVEGFCRDIDIHDELSALYATVFDIFD